MSRDPAQSRQDGQPGPSGAASPARAANPLGPPSGRSSERGTRLAVAAVLAALAAAATATTLLAWLDQGLGLRDAALAVTLVTTLALVAGGGLMGELPILLLGTVAFHLILTVALAAMFRRWRAEGGM